MTSNNKYGRNHIVNGVWHPLGTWTKMPRFEQAKLGQIEDWKYHQEEDKFTRDQNTYYRLHSEIEKDPCRWYECVPQVRWYPKSGSPFRVLLEGLEFEMTLSEAEVAALSEYKKGEKACDTLLPDRTWYMGSQPFIQWPWEEEWRAQLFMDDQGVLQISCLRAMPKLCTDLRYGESSGPRSPVARAIADESPVDDYIVRIRCFNLVTSDKNDQEYLVLTFEVLSGQARGFLGELFFAETERSSIDCLPRIEAALGIEHEMWRQMVTARSTFGSTDPINLSWPYFKACLDLSGEYPKLENPRKVEEKEVAYWL